MTAASAPPKKKIFYGWWILAVSVAGAFLASTTSQLFTGALLPDIERGTGWSRSSITVAVTMGSVAVGLTSPFFGRWVDRYGSRWLSALGAIVTSVALLIIALSGTIHIVVFYVGFIVARGASSNTLTGVVPRTAMVNWFRRKRGRALGFVSMAVPLGGAALVPIAKAISSVYGWETVYYVFAVVLVVVLVPATLLVLRRRPEDMGLRPDGDDEPPPEPAAGARSAAASRPLGADSYDWSLKQAMRTPPFWMLIGAMTCGTFANGGIGFHQAAYFEDQGIAEAAVALALSSYAISGALANGVWGFLVEHMSERLLGAVTLFLASLLPLYLLTVDSAAGALIFAVALGLFARGETSIIVLIQAQYFGRGSFGTITGFTTPFQQISLGLGPTVAAVIYDLTGGSYTIAFVMFGVMWFLAAAMIWFSRKPALPPEALAAGYTS